MSPEFAFLKALGVFRDLVREKNLAQGKSKEESEKEGVQATLVQVFLAVCVQPGLTMKEIMERLDISQSSCSRNIAALGHQHRLGDPGLGLVEAVEDPAERRRKIVTLTRKGKKVQAELRSLLK